MFITFTCRHCPSTPYSVLLSLVRPTERPKVRLVRQVPDLKTKMMRHPLRRRQCRVIRKDSDKGKNISVGNAQSTEHLGQIGNYDEHGAWTGRITPNALTTRARLRQSSVKIGLQESSCTTLSTCGPVCPSRMLPSNTKNSSTRDVG